MNIIDQYGRPNYAHFNPQEPDEDLARWLFHSLREQRRKATTYTTFTDTNGQQETKNR